MCCYLGCLLCVQVHHARCFVCAAADYFAAVLPSVLSEMLFASYCELYYKDLPVTKQHSRQVLHARRALSLDYLLVG